jgi:hypothetical protein
VPLPVSKLRGATAFLLVYLEVKPGGDCLLGHVLGKPELDQGADLVSHDLVSSSLDGSDDVVDEHAPILPAL